MAGSRWNNALIRAWKAQNITLIGEPGSVIDGNNTYDAIGEENYRGPHGITFFSCKNIRAHHFLKSFLATLSLLFFLNLNGWQRWKTAKEVLLKYSIYVNFRT